MRFITPLSRACSYIDARLADFKINPAPSWLFASIKAITELAHAADCLHRTPDPHCQAVAERWMDFAWTQTRSGELFRELIAADARLLPIGIGALPFHLFGHRNAALQATLLTQLRKTQLDPLGFTLVVPALRILGIAADEAMAAKARPLSVLCNRPDPARLPQDAVYLLAHECLYASSWGHHAPRYDADTAAYVATALPALITAACAANDADVLAELILALHASNLQCPEARVWQVLQAAQDTAGNVVPHCPLFTIFPRLVHPILQRTYHTTLVAIMAWSACRHDELRETNLS